MLSSEEEPDRGFTLIELLVVMIVIGVLAAIAVPAFLMQKQKAYETAAKSDAESIAKEVTGYYVDGHALLTLSAGADPSTWLLSDGTGVVAEGRLTTGNEVSTHGAISSEDAYCVAVDPTRDGVPTWRATQAGLASGDCP